MLFGKKKEEKNCCCSDSSESSCCNSNDKNGIIILGSGCKKCNDLEEHVKRAMTSLGITEEIKHITDYTEIASFGIMSTPALAIDGKVISYGKVLSETECVEILKEYRK